MWFNTEPRRANNPTLAPMSTAAAAQPDAPFIANSGTQQERNKRLVLCFDGTNDQYDQLNSNVVDFFSVLAKDDVNQQVCYYQPGVGTYESNGMFNALSLWYARIMDEAFATYLPTHIMQGYEFIMQNYSSGDKIYLFGFSRGAYTARALAGMLYKVGLLPKDNTTQIPFAYSIFANQSKTGATQAAGFKQTFCRTVTVDFIGVWETVASVGLLMSPNLPFSNSAGTVRVFRQALSLDEHRVRFIPTFWSPNDDKTDDASSTASAAQKTKKFGPVNRVWKKVHNRHQVISAFGESVSERNDKGQHKEKIASVPSADGIAGNGGPQASTEPTSTSGNGGTGTSPPSTTSPVTPMDTDVLEVWFSGCHSDVGGGAVSDSTQHALHFITLRWMVRQILVTSTDILLDPAALERLNLADLDPDSSTATPPISSTVAGSSEMTLDSTDALTPLHDELVLDKWWWVLEYLPMKYAPTEGSKTVVGLHRGRGRVITNRSPNIHITVQDRMKDAKLAYKPKAKWTGTPNWVE